MPHSKVPADVQDFVAWYLPTVQHLEVLMLLQRNPTRSWSPGEVATELRMSHAAAARVLERLASDNFLDIKISSDVVYRFNPAFPPLVGAAARCAEFYARHRVALTRLTKK